MREFADADVAILSAAVADYRPATVATEKIKREKKGAMDLSLEPTHDIAAEIGRMKQPHQRVIGFALETNDEENNALQKLEKKNADFIVLNSLRNEGTCFRTDENKISIIGRTFRKEFEKKPKAAVAEDILDAVESLLV